MKLFDLILGCFLLFSCSSEHNKVIKGNMIEDEVISEQTNSIWLDEFHFQPIEIIELKQQEQILSHQLNSYNKKQYQSLQQDPLAFLKKYDSTEVMDSAAAYYYIWDYYAGLQRIKNSNWWLTLDYVSKQEQILALYCLIQSYNKGWYKSLLPLSIYLKEGMYFPLNDTVSLQLKNMYSSHTDYVKLWIKQKENRFTQMQRKSDKIENSQLCFIDKLHKQYVLFHTEYNVKNKQDTYKYYEHTTKENFMLGIGLAQTQKQSFMIYTNKELNDSIFINNVLTQELLIPFCCESDKYKFSLIVEEAYPEYCKVWINRINTVWILKKDFNFYMWDEILKNKKIIL